MSTEVVQLDNGRALVALGRFRLSLEQRGELMQELAQSQLVSVRRTFREQGAPANSWVPLAESTIRRNPKLYGAGHKLLIVSGRLLNSISVLQTTNEQVTIGTNLAYARVQNDGSRDRGTPIGPKTEAESKTTVDVAAHDRFLSPYERRWVLSHSPSAKVEGPVFEGKNRQRVRAEGPRMANYERFRLAGPANRQQVSAHSRHQNIPGRRYMVFRPEDPNRMRGVVTRYIKKAREAAGLEGEA